MHPSHQKPPQQPASSAEQAPGVDHPCRVAIAGIGGFAAAHHEALRDLEQTGSCRLVATCDPALNRLQTDIDRWQLNQRQVQIFPSFEDMLEKCAEELDYVVVSTPIPLHASMHRQVAEAGLGVYLEKPPTLDPQEMEAMLSVEAQAKFKTLVGFNFIGEPERLDLKKQLLAGRFGALQSVALSGFWPRPRSYYTRAAWSGRLLDPSGKLILDNCLGNGLAHHVHNMLHWAGLRGVNDWATPRVTQAWLGRAHAIESADSVLVSTSLDGIPLRIALSHACNGPSRHEEIIQCSGATIRYVTRSHYSIDYADGRTMRIPLAPYSPVLENHLAYAAYLRGGGHRPFTTLAASEPFLRLHSQMLLSATTIHQFNASEITEHRQPGNDDCLIAVQNLEQRLLEFVDNGIWPFTEPRKVEPTGHHDFHAHILRLAGRT